MNREEALARLGRARVGRLGTVTPEGRPHVVPFVFALDGETLYWAVDAKPKRARNLRRLENIRATPDVEVVVDHYEEDWETLWWVRATGFARILPPGEEADRARTLLMAKYRQYAGGPPEGPFVAVALAGVTGWVASPGAPSGS